MKIKPEQLGSQLQKGLLPVYLLTGEEPLLLEESLDLLRRTLHDKGFIEREVVHVESGFNGDILLQSASNLSLFAEQKIIELRLGSHKLNKQAGDVLCQYLADAPEDNVLLISASKLDGNAKKSSWFKAIDKQGLIVEIWPVELAQLPNWLSQRAARLGLQLDNDAIQLLCDRVEGNLLAADQELNKLSLLFGQQPVSADVIIDAVSDSSRYDIYGLTDTALQGDAKRCLKIIQVLQQDGTEAPVVLWALARELRALAAIRDAQRHGQSFDAICQRERIWGKRKTLARQAAQRLSDSQLQQGLQQAARVDRMVKGLEAGDPWLEITSIGLTLAGHPLSFPEAP